MNDSTSKTTDIQLPDHVLLEIHELRLLFLHSDIAHSKEFGVKEFAEKFFNFSSKYEWQTKAE